MTKKEKIKVTAIVVTHDGESWLPAVVAALALQTRPIDRIIAVDTGSLDSSARLLTSARIEVIREERTCGFGDAVARAVAEINFQGEDSNQWIWLIHDDCAPVSTALEKLIEAVENKPQVAIVGPKLLGWHDRTHLLEAGVSIAGNGARWTGLEPLEYDQGQHDGIHDVLAVSTAGALIRKDIFEEVGGFDSNLSLFRDDIDLGWRVRVAGHSVLVTSHAVAFHAQAATNERRSVDVIGAFLHRPLLLDRRNAAYVLLANSSWWMLPWLTIQLFSSALVRSIGYLLVKLPGYASDELLAVVTLVIKPAVLFKARKERKSTRLVSPRVISVYVPPRWSQLRLSLSKLTQAIRAKIFPVQESPTISVLDSLDDEDLLVPTKSTQWFNILRKPEAAGYLLLGLITLLASHNRIGALLGGSLVSSPSGASDLWRSYFESWHSVGLGSPNATAPWVPILALLSLVTGGKISLFTTIFFLAAPVLMMWSCHSLLQKYSGNKFITIPASFLYAMSPVALAAVNSGRLATIVILILAPRIPLILNKWREIETIAWRRIYGLTIILAIFSAFTLVTTVISFGLVASSIFLDYRILKEDNDKEVFLARLYRRLVILLVPFFMITPYSLEALLSPSKFLAEPGLAIAGGSTPLVLTANPGGPGALPWWGFSPILLILLVALFSSTLAKEASQFGILVLSGAVFFTAFKISVHGSSNQVSVWTGTFIAIATLCATVSGVVILDRLRSVLISSNIHYRHIMAAMLLLLSASYGVISTAWAISAGADSPVKSGHQSVMPAFLSAEQNEKTLVLREFTNGDRKSVQYYISRGPEIFLGDPDIVPQQVIEIEDATKALIDGSGITSSKTLASYGIKYVFVKSPYSATLIQTIDGLGGFSRTSATSAGVVWRVAGEVGRLIYTSTTGERTVLPTAEVGARTIVPGPGTLTLSESYDRSWQVLENGYRLPKARNAQGLPEFTVTEAGEISLIHDGTIRRAWLSLQLIVITVAVVMALPAGRKRREISEEELA